MEELADALSERFLVITYDRRGLSRSPASLDAPPVDMYRHANDAAVILRALAPRPARVLGSSFGALLALHVAEAYPDGVSTVIAHEPPLSEVVRDPALDAAMERIARIAQRDIRAALAELAALAGEGNQDEAGEESAEITEESVGNMRWFFRHDLHAVQRSGLTADRVAALPDRVRVVPSGGAQTPRERWENRCARELAARIGQPLLELPGGHDGLTIHPNGVAEVISRLAP
ncbi:alpha/beta fold hydrolase [Prauserella sp. ASG 168]|uniref:Alpha/beta fold hydrolase n=1 Tax=Prauserella cavernicola TaxID=2800127 RepID=A0A934QXF6_9PSEU|nr:alpha/beta fold hydrolase [Prauserella cavernicola]